MKFQEMLKDSVKYSLSNWYNILILGFILFLLDHIIDSDFNFTFGDGSEIFIAVVMVMVIVILSFMEIGYGFRIVEETVKGSRSPPSFRHPFNLISHGIKESIILIAYFIIPLILVILGVSGVETYLNFDFSFIMDYAIAMAVIFFILFNLMFQGAVLTMAHHEGSLRSGFNIIKVFRKIKQVGFLDMIFISIITIIVIYILKQAIFDTLHGLPYIGSTVGDVLATVIIAPFLLLFNTRLLGLVDVDEGNKSSE